MKYIKWFSDLDNNDVNQVGGKNASLGEMIGALKEKGVRVPDGFATTAEAYRRFLEANELTENIRSHLRDLRDDRESLEDVGAAIRSLITDGEWPDDISEEIRSAYRTLSERYDVDAVDVAARSSATAEDLPEASFAGQQETYLNVRGEEDLLDACRKCLASLFTDRAITYREQHDFDHMAVALSVGIQKMVRSDKASAGVLFTVDTETGFPDVALINAGWGLGENVVKGTINPDQYTVYTPFLERERVRPIIGRTLGTKEWTMVYEEEEEKEEEREATSGPRSGTIHETDVVGRLMERSGINGAKRRNGEDGSSTVNRKTAEADRGRFVLSDDDILQLARWGVVIEDHYQRAMDIEWAKDGDSGDLYIVQARPETVQSQAEAGRVKAFELKEKGERLVSGLSIGQAIASGKACVIMDVDDIDRFVDGSILVTDMTDPDWGPVMKRASGIVTDHGGRTSHAAIVSRELGIPAVIGTGDATEVLEDQQEITLSCAEGDQGFVYEGLLDFEESEIDLSDLPAPRTRIMMNIASPAGSMRWWQLPCRGVGLARMEYIINNIIKAHPLALVHFDELDDEDARLQIEEITRGYEDKAEFFVDTLAHGIAMIAAAQYQEPVIVRMSDFKTNEYAGLIGGGGFEPEEENPMLGWRGASRYYSDAYKAGFELECRAVRRAREQMGFDNVIVMIPFCRTPDEADRVLETMAEFGLARGENGLEIYVMAEIPSNIIQADEFADRFDGFSIGSNDLTQLVLGVDRDAENLSYLFDERNTSVKRLIKELVRKAHKADRPVGICGQAPSDYPDFAEFLVQVGINSISLNPDSVVDVVRLVASAEQKMGEAEPA